MWYETCVCTSLASMTWLLSYWSTVYSTTRCVVQHKHNIRLQPNTQGGINQHNNQHQIYSMGRLVSHKMIDFTSDLPTLTWTHLWALPKVPLMFKTNVRIVPHKNVAINVYETWSLDMSCLLNVVTEVNGACAALLKTHVKM